MARSTKGLLLSSLTIGLLVLPSVYPSSYVSHVVEMVGLYAILSVALNVLTGISGQISFGHAAFYGLGAYTVAILGKHGLAWPVSIVIATILCALSAYLIGLPVLRLRGHYLGMATLALGLLFYTAVIQWVGLTGGPDGMAVAMPHFDFRLPFRIAEPVYYLIVLAAIGTFLIGERIRNSKIGVCLRVVREDEVAAESMGYNPARLKTGALVISAMFSGLAGSLYALLNGYINPDPFNLATSVAVVTMVVVGGAGNTLGALVGASLLTIIPEVFYSFQEYRLVFYGLVLILCLIFLPHGFVPEKPSCIGFTARFAQKKQS